MIKEIKEKEKSKTPVREVIQVMLTIIFLLGTIVLFTLAIAKMEQLYFIATVFCFQQLMISIRGL